MEQSGSKKGPAIGLAEQAQQRRQMVLVVLVFWIVVGLLYLLSLILNAQQFGTGFRVSSKTVTGTLLIYVAWAVASLAMIESMRRIAQQPNVSRYVLLLCLGALIWLPLSLVIDGALADWMFQRERRSPLTILRQTNYFSAFFVTMLYIMVFFAGLGWTYLERWRHERERALELAKQDVQNRLDLADMRMQVLKAQLSPHFLFNALGSISGLARTAPRSQVITAVQQLGDMLRYALSTSEQRLINIDSELSFTANYVELQRLRFNDRFEFSIESQAPSHLACPPFVLQTLVENAFVHSVEARSERTRIDALVECSKDALIFTVRNQFSAGKNGAPGLGLALSNLSRRLEMMFSSRAVCEGYVVGDQYVARVALPRAALH